MPSTINQRHLGSSAHFVDNTVYYNFHRNGVAYTFTVVSEDEIGLVAILQSWEFTE